MKYKRIGNIGLFDKDSAIDLMSEMGNQLEKLGNTINFEMFRPLLEEKLIKND